MTLPTILRRRPAPRPVILSVTNHFVVAPAGSEEPWRRTCVVRMPSGEVVRRTIRESRLVELGLVAAAA